MAKLAEICHDADREMDVTVVNWCNGQWILGFNFIPPNILSIPLPLSSFILRPPFRFVRCCKSIIWKFSLPFWMLALRVRTN